MNLLAIDTSTECASVALLANNVIVQSEQHHVREHARYLLPMIAGLLNETGITYQQLDGVAFGCGPGSFTGLRISCSVAKGLAYANDLPLYPVSSLVTIAAQVYAHEPYLSDDTHILVLMDARMQQMYCANFIKQKQLGIEKVLAAADVYIPGNGPVVIAGVDFSPYLSQLPETICSRVTKQLMLSPSAVSMLNLVTAGKVLAVSAADALPVYVRNQVTHVHSNSSKPAHKGL
ncbi:MAG: tRNA (adenosine(37)-N6)-threonylcarbamoyltransferase complex dimerization subunit type 1 TsaB [Legionella sp.]